MLGTAEGTFGDLWIRVTLEEEVEWPPSLSSMLTFSLSMAGSLCWRSGFIASATVSPGGVPVNDPDFVLDMTKEIHPPSVNYYWTVNGTLPGTVEIGFVEGKGIVSSPDPLVDEQHCIPAVITPRLSCYNTGGMDAEERSDAKVTIPRVVMGGETKPIEGTVDSVDGKTFYAMPGPIAVFLDEDWAKEHDEYAASTYSIGIDGEEGPAINNLRWKLDVPPPALSISGSPYWKGPFEIAKWGFISLTDATRRLLKKDGGSLDEPITTQSPIDAEYMTLWNCSRWSFNVGEPEWDGNRWTVTMPEAASLTATRIIFSYFTDRQLAVGQTDAIPPPPCYRITKANFYWPLEPRYLTNNGTPPCPGFDPLMTRPEDNYDLTGFRYLVFWQEVSSYPSTVTVTLHYSVPTPDDNHLTGQVRVDEYSCDFAGGTWQATVAVDKSGYVLLDLLDLYPKPRIVNDISFNWSDLEEGTTVSQSLVGAVADIPDAINAEPEQPATPHAVLKWLPRCDDTELVASARADDTPALEVLDHYRIHLEKGVPSIEWLYGSGTGIDLSSALTLAQVISLVNGHEGWSATWYEDSWNDKCLYVHGEDDEYLLEPGYPWDVRFVAGTTIESDAENPSVKADCCIGSKSHGVASGAVYDLHATCFLRGRLDGIALRKGKAARNYEGAAVVKSRWDEEEEWNNEESRDSDAHGSFWSMAEAEFHCEDDDCEDDDLKSWQYAVWPGPTASGAPAHTSACGIGEWIYIGRVIIPPPYFPMLSTDVHFSGYALLADAQHSDETGLTRIRDLGDWAERLKVPAHPDLGETTCASVVCSPSRVDLAEGRDIPYVHQVRSIGEAGEWATPAALPVSWSYPAAIWRNGRIYLTGYSVGVQFLSVFDSVAPFSNIRGPYEIAEADDSSPAVLGVTAAWGLAAVLQRDEELFVYHSLDSGMTWEQKLSLGSYLFPNAYMNERDLLWTCAYDPEKGRVVFWEVDPVEWKVKEGPVEVGQSDKGRAAVFSTPSWVLVVAAPQVTKWDGFPNYPAIHEYISRDRGRTWERRAVHQVT